MGWVQAAHGLKGEVEIRIASGDLSWLKLLTRDISQQSASILLNGQPHLCEAVRQKQEFLLLRLRDIADRTKAESLKSSSFAIPNRYLVSKPGETIYLSEILEFSVVDHDVAIGKIVGFSSNGPQDLLRVESPAGEVFEIPFVEAFIRHIHFDLRRLDLQLPPGLLDINRK